MAWASTVAVVVPSPATSLVLVATSLASWAPRFSYGLLSSISRAMVTPSFVIVGAPNFLSITTLRPLGPSVTLTALSRNSRTGWSRGSALEDGEHVTRGQDEVFLTVVLHLGAAVLAVDHLVAD